MTSPYDETLQLDARSPETPAEKSTYPVGACLGDYRVMSVLGGPGLSGMGVVYVLEKSSGGWVAAKTFQHHVAKEFSLIRRFMREARTWLLLGSHPYIVRAIALEIIDALPMLIMEYVAPGRSGGSLDSRIARGPLPPGEVARLALQCCDALSHAAAAVPGFVHRDLKPENLLLDEYDNIKMTDFGLVRCLTCDDPIDPADPVVMADGLTNAGSIMGTPAYMAPEQFTDPESVDARADVYALGCCLYEALSGQTVFPTEGKSGVELFMKLRAKHLSQDPIPLQAYGVECPDAFCDVIMRCLAKDPADRWSSAEELRHALFEAARDWRRVPEEPMREALHTAAAVAENVRALNLLDGYERAISHRSLREHFHESPYAFHLALSSFFHVDGNEDEEARQLERAVRAAGPQSGYEAVRRLAEVQLRAGHVASAYALLKTYLDRNPDGVSHVIEPYIEVLIRRGDFDCAIDTLQPFVERRRGKRMLADVYKAAGREVEYKRTLLTLFGQSIDALSQKVQEIEAGQTVGVDDAGDIDVLCGVIDSLLPESSCARFRTLIPAPWPHLDIDHDLGPDLAYISWAAGELAACNGEIEPDESGRYAKLAEMLNHPVRFERFIHRDEHWIWQQPSGILG